MKYTTRTKR